jgi:hypothetical protein
MPLFRHLEDVDQTYGEHFKDAMHFSWCSFKCSLKFFIHALLPNMFKTDGSREVMELNETIREKKIDIFNRLYLRSRTRAPKN